MGQVTICCVFPFNVTPCLSWQHNLDEVSFFLATCKCVVWTVLTSNFVYPNWSMRTHSLFLLMCACHSCTWDVMFSHGLIFVLIKAYLYLDTLSSFQRSMQPFSTICCPHLHLSLLSKQGHTQSKPNLVDTTKQWHKAMASLEIPSHFGHGLTLELFPMFVCPFMSMIHLILL